MRLVFQHCAFLNLHTDSNNPPDHFSAHICDDDDDQFHRLFMVFDGAIEVSIVAIVLAHAKLVSSSVRIHGSFIVVRSGWRRADARRLKCWWFRAKPKSVQSKRVSEQSIDNFQRPPIAMQIAIGRRVRYHNHIYQIPYSCRDTQEGSCN